MQRINNDIKTENFKQIYLLYGEESYLVRQYTNRLKEALLGSGDKMNLNVYNGKDTEQAKIISMAETLPFFAERRVIVLENSGYFKSGGEELAQYLATPCETTYFVFAESSIDKRSKLFKTVQKSGLCVEFPRQSEDTLVKWVLSLLKKENKQISAGAMELFLSKTGTDMEYISRELEKLICYCMDKSAITEVDVETICTYQVQSDIFDLIAAIGKGNPREALDLYYQMLEKREPSMKILVLMERQFNQLLQIRQLLEKRYSNQQIGEKVGLKPFIVGKLAATAKRFPMPVLKKALEACVETEYGVKSGQITDKMGVELLIVEYATK